MNFFRVEEGGSVCSRVKVEKLIKEMGRTGREGHIRDF